MLGILADVNVRGQVETLIGRMQSERWREFWLGLGLVFRHFEDVGLASTTTDREVWKRCQAEQLILITNNRNRRRSDSLEATIRELNTPNALPVCTIANLDRLRTDREYAERVVVRLYEYILGIEALRGTGRLYLP